MIYNERDLREAQALDIAQKMLVAARTAPKGKGIDVLECAVVNSDEKGSSRGRHGKHRQRARACVLPSRCRMRSRMPMCCARRDQT